jgi:hypothetical protein
MGKIAVGVAPKIDFAQLSNRTNLRDLIVAELGQPDRHKKWVCPFHADKHPSMSISPKGRRFKCWSCGESGDALDWVRLRNGVDVVEAARILEPSLRPNPEILTPMVKRSTPSPIRIVAPKPVDPIPWQDPDWQAAIDQLVLRAEKRLWSPEGRDALGWLRTRGLADHIIGMFRLGYVAKDGKPEGIWAPRGIVVPWLAPGAWYGPSTEPTDAHGNPIPRWVGAMIRKLMPDVLDPWLKEDQRGKCHTLAGSRRGYGYPYDDFPKPGRPCLIAEGEFDALIAFQEIGHIVDVMTVGGALQTPAPQALDALAGCSHWLVASDYDAAGTADVAKWRERGPGKVRRLMLPDVNDLTDYFKAGGNLREWIAGELHRFGLTD